MSRSIIQHARSNSGCALSLCLLLCSGCREPGEPDVPATVAPYFPVTSSEQEGPRFDAAIATERERPGDVHDAESTSEVASAASDLPCEVANLLRTRCSRCHGSPPLPGVPISLASYADLTAPAKTQPGVSNAQRALVRAQMNTMPPGGGLTSAEVDLLARWVEAGAKPDRCDVRVAVIAGDDARDASTEAAVALDAGPRDAQASDAIVGDPNATPDANRQDASSDASSLDDAGGEDASSRSECMSQSRWAGGDAGSALMRPGTPCLSCHGERAPIFTFAGSIYASAHEPDQCNGAAANDAVVVIKAANGYKLALTINAAGNFFTQTALPKPYTVEIRYQGRTRLKQQPQTSGDCNGCHSELGSNGASGRITLP